MQYGKAAFSKNNENTMEAITDSKIELGGNVMTQQDVNELNTLYDCRSKRNNPICSYYVSFKSILLCFIVFNRIFIFQ